MDVAQRKRSRFDRKPALNKRGEPRNVLVTERDRTVIFPLLAKYRYLDTLWLHAFVGGDYQSLQRHLNLLYRNGYINRPLQQTKNLNAYYRPVIHELDERGAEVLRAHGHNVPTLRHYRNFAHKHHECIFDASVDLGMRANPSIKRTEWEDILNNPNFPPETREAKDPVAIHLPSGDILRCDGNPFVLNYDGRAFRFCVKEIDCDTESGDSYAHNSIRWKIESYLLVIDRELYTTQFGATTFHVHFLTTNPGREALILRMIDTVMRENKYPLTHARRIAVKWTPGFASLERPTPPSGFILTEPWKRGCGLSDFQLDQP